MHSLLLGMYLLHTCLRDFPHADLHSLSPCDLQVLELYSRQIPDSNFFLSLKGSFFCWPPSPLAEMPRFVFQLLHTCDSSSGCNKMKNKRCTFFYSYVLNFPVERRRDFAHLGVVIRTNKQNKSDIGIPLR